MGEIVGAGVVAHVPPIMVEAARRRALNGGRDTTLVDGLARLKAEVLLDTVRRTTFEVRPGVSLGEEVQAETEALVASGITWEGRLLHLACFATG